MERNQTCGLSQQHLVSFEHAGAGACKGRAVQEFVARHVITIRPYAKVRIVIHQIRTPLKRVPVISARRISGLRNRNALIKCRVGKLTDQPAIRQLIVQNNRITAIVGFARTAEARPQHIDMPGG